MHWVFDLDGTLVDSFSHYFVALREIFEQHGVRFSEKLHDAALTKPLTLFFGEHLGAGAVPEALEQIRLKSSAAAPHVLPFEGVLPAIERLHSQGARIGVWTNRDLASAELILRHTGLDRWTETCVSGTCVTRRKPHPEGLLRIIELFGCEPSSVIVVGDHEHDVLGARAAGARAVRASWHSYWKIPRCQDADYQFYRFQDFASWASRQNSGATIHSTSDGAKI